MRGESEMQLYNVDKPMNLVKSIYLSNYHPLLEGRAIKRQMRVRNLTLDN